MHLILQNRQCNTMISHFREINSQTQLVVNKHMINILQHIQNVLNSNESQTLQRPDHFNTEV